jgi:hypothetical protein
MTFIDPEARGLAPLATSTLTSCAWGNTAPVPVAAENLRKPKNMHARKIIKTTSDRLPSPLSRLGFLNSAIKTLLSIANTRNRQRVSRPGLASSICF